MTKEKVKDAPEETIIELDYVPCSPIELEIKIN